MSLYCSSETKPSTHSPLDGTRGGKLCFKQRASSVYPPVPLWLILYPLTPSGQRGPVCRRKHGAGHRADTQTRGRSGTAGEEELGRKWREPPPGGRILSLGKTGLFVQRSELFVCMCAQKHSCQRAKNCANLSRDGVSTKSVSLRPCGVCRWSRRRCNMWHSSANSTPC